MQKHLESCLKFKDEGRIWQSILKRQRADPNIIILEFNLSTLSFVNCCMLFFPAFLVGPKLKQLEVKCDNALIVFMFDDMLCGSYSMKFHII